MDKWPDPKICDHPRIKVTGSGVFCWACGVEMIKQPNHGYTPKLVKPTENRRPS